MNKKEYVEFFLTNEDFRDESAVKGIVLICSLMGDVNCSYSSRVVFSREEQTAFRVYLDMAEKFRDELIDFHASGKWAGMPACTNIPFHVDADEVDNTIAALDVGLKTYGCFIKNMEGFLSWDYLSESLNDVAVVRRIKDQLVSEQSRMLKQRCMSSASRKRSFEEI